MTTASLQLIADERAKIMGKHKDLIVLCSSEDELSDFHEDFIKSAACKVHGYMEFIVDLAKTSNGCAPCALLSMTSTLMANMFVLFEPESESGEGLLEVLHGMVENAKEAAKTHMDAEADIDSAEDKLAEIYISRGK